MDIIFEQLKETGIIKLNRPKALNALNYDMSEKFSYQLDEWEKNEDIKRVLLVGEGKHFCAGGDVKSLSLKGKSSELRKNFFLSEYKLNYKISNFKKPYLSLWNGVVMGGGVGLSLYGNYRIVTDTTKFAMPETSIGFFPDVGASYFLPRIKNNFGIYLALTGHVINSNEILKLGLGTHYCPYNQTENFIDQYVMKGNIKQFKIQPNNSSGELYNNSLIYECFQGDIKNIFKKLQSSNMELFNILNKKCPMSLAATSFLLEKGRNKSLKQCLEMEFKLSQNMVYREDFDEGIDAVLISKHNKPNWNPSTIIDINLKEVDKLFESNQDSLKL
tara:strand:+ start:5285 stop:6277 length:993 start_codon:yes stop_codon:yes gene_type:complete